MNLDATDVKILKVLQENGRLSFRQIADRVKVSVPTVSSKIGNMENLGIIKGYLGRLDSEKLGGISVVLNIKTKPADTRQVADQFLENENVREIFVLGNGKLLLVCTFSQQHLINAFISSLAEIHQIMEYDIANIINVVKEEPRAIISDEANVVLQCAYCKKEIHDHAYRVRMDDQEYYVCCTVCQKNIEVKYQSMKSEATKART